MSIILVTGAAGFIGYHLGQELLARGETVVGLDNLNDYYDVRLKEARLARLRTNPGFAFVKADLADRARMERVFAELELDRVVHLAGQAGVRHSLTNPHDYINSNVVGFLNVLEGCRSRGVRHLVFASSSSVYGANRKLPFSVRDRVDHPISLYAASKRSNELMAHSYAHLYGMPCTGLRFFSVYGPWGRPDMAVFLFTKAILEERPIDVFNHGRHRRDFTYIGDVVDGVMRVLAHPPERGVSCTGSISDLGGGRVPFRLYNIGSGKPVDLLYVIGLLEAVLRRKARLDLVDIQPGDVVETCAEMDDLARDFGFRPQVSIEEGVERFVAWYRDYCPIEG